MLSYSLLRLYIAVMASLFLSYTAREVQTL